MIREILDERVAELHQKESEDAKRAKQRAEEVEKAIEAFQAQIPDMLKKAPVESFKVSEMGYYPAIIVKHPEDSKGSFEKDYTIYVGSFTADPVIGMVRYNKEIGTVKVTLSFIFSELDLSGMFKDEHPIVTQQGNITIFTFAS